MKRLFFLLSPILFFSACINKSPQKRVKENNLFYDTAFSYLDSAKVDKAFLYFNKAKDLFLQQKDSLGVGKCLVNMAIISTNEGDYFGGQEISINAIPYFDKEKENHQIYIKSNLNNLGKASIGLADYSKAITFYTQSLNYAKDTASSIIVENNIANAYSEKGDYEKSVLLYETILKRGVKDSKEYARVLTNSSVAKWHQDFFYKAAPYFLLALQIRKKEGDLAGLHSSYGHLSDYYAQIKPDSALFYAHKMYLVAKKINNANDQLMALQKLIRLSPANETKGYFSVFEKLDDSLQTARAAAKNQFALIRYETEKHKAENLTLQKDNTEKKYQLIKQKALLTGSLTLAFFVIVISIVLYKKRKQRIELASQNAIRENQLKTSKKVHDVVANGLYRVMTEIENTKNLDRDEVLDKLEDMYEKSRDLSYEEIHYSDQNFHEKITTLLKSFATETTKIVFMGNTEELWKKVDRQIKYEIEHILQELMVNMKKHSGASNVAIRFEQQEDRIAIYYADNGVGMASEQQFKNGLTNTGNRIININGEITFETKMEKGLKIQISFPVLNR